MRGVLAFFLFVLLLTVGCAAPAPPAQAELDPQKQELAETVQKYSWSNNWMENHPILGGSTVVSLLILYAMAMSLGSLGH
jgi:hypothetical protein